MSESLLGYDSKMALFELVAIMLVVDSQASKQYGVPLSGGSLEKEVSLPKEQVAGEEEHTTWLMNLANPLHFWGPEDMILLPDEK